MKVFGKEIKEFYLDDSEPYDGHEDCEIDFFDVEELDSNIKYDLKLFGSLQIPGDEGRWISFESVSRNGSLNKHMKNIDNFSKDQLENVKQLLKQIKGLKIE